MPYFKKHNLVFIHMPKSGGSSVGRFLSGKMRFGLELSGDYRFWWNIGLKRAEIEKLKRINPDRRHGYSRQPLMHHFTAQDVCDFLSADRYESTRRFCIVRNPWDRLVSFYEYGRQTGGRMKTGGLSFQEWFVTRPITPRILPYIRVNDQVDPEMCCLRFEDFDAAFGGFVNTLGLRWNGNIHEKRTQRDDYRTYYTDAMTEVLYDECREDIDYFGYRFD